LVVTGHREVKVVYEVSLCEIGATTALAPVAVGPTTAVVEFAEMEKPLDTVPVAPIAPTVLLPVIGAEWVCVAR